MYSSKCVGTGSARISIFLRFSAIPGSGRSVPGRPTYNAPRSPTWARHPLFAGDREGLLCEWDVAPQRARGRPSGARYSQLFFGCYNKNISKITATSQACYIIRIYTFPEFPLKKETRKNLSQENEQRAKKQERFTRMYVAFFYTKKYSNTTKEKKAGKAGNLHRTIRSSIIMSSIIRRRTLREAGLSFAGKQEIREASY